MDLRKLMFLVVGLFLFSGAIAQEKTKLPGQEALVASAEAYAKALEKGDFEKVLKFTHTKVIEAFGGRQKMLAQAEREEMESKRAGFEVDKVELAEPLEGTEVGNTLYRCIPIRVTVVGPYGKIFTQSGLLGISADQGKTWHFVSLAQIETVRLLEIFPELPKTLELPLKQISTEK